MISAETVRYLTDLPRTHLEAIAWQSGYKGDRYKTAEFLGMTNGGQFCYAITFVEEGEVRKGKVFLSYDPAADRVSLDY